MKKSYSIRKDEINVFEIWETIWNGKIKIALITAIFFIIIAGYNKFQPEKPISFKSSLVIGKIKPEKLFSFIPIFDFLSQSKFGTNFNDLLLNRFVDEFMDYDELVTVLKKNETIKKNISQLSDFDRQQQLYNYAKSFEIVRATNKVKGEEEEKISGYVMKFYWQGEAKEIRDIYDQTVNLTLKTLKKSLFNELDLYFKIKKQKIFDADFSRIKYLTEQSMIANELNIVDNKLDFVSISEPNVLYNFNASFDDMYYLRGYKAINKEISFIKSRKYIEIYEIEKKIELLKKKDIKFINYNIFLLDLKSTKNHKTLAWPISIIIGLMIGVLYVFISNAFQSLKYTRKKN